MKYFAVSFRDGDDFEESNFTIIVGTNHNVEFPSAVLVEEITDPNLLVQADIIIP